MTGRQSQPSKKDAGGPIPFEEDVAPPPRVQVPKTPLTKPGATNRQPASNAPAPKCPDCGYSLAGIQGARCPECGGDIGKSSVAKARRQRAAVEQRSEYWKAFYITLAGLAVMALAVAFTGWLNDEFDQVPLRVLVALGSYVVLVPLGYLAYFLLAAVWFGSDEPPGMTILRLAAAYALADAVSEIVSIAFILFLTQALIFGAYIGLLMKFLELDAMEATVLALVTALLKFIVIVWVLHAIGVI
jgi:hypothetical protein